MMYLSNDKIRGAVYQYTLEVRNLESHLYPFINVMPICVVLTQKNMDNFQFFLEKPTSAECRENPPVKETSLSKAQLYIVAK